MERENCKCHLYAAFETSSYAMSMSDFSPDSKCKPCFPYYRSPTLLYTDAFYLLQLASSKPGPHLSLGVGDIGL